MFLGMTAYLFCIADAGAVDISSVLSVSVISSKMFCFVILNDPSHSDSTFISFP